MIRANAFALRSMMWIAFNVLGRIELPTAE